MNRYMGELSFTGSKTVKLRRRNPTTNNRHTSIPFTYRYCSSYIARPAAAARCKTKGPAAAAAAAAGC